MSKLLAKYVTVKANGKTLAGLTDCTFNGSTVFSTSETKEDKGAVDTPDYPSWEISVSGVLGREDSGKATAGELKAAIIAGTVVPIVYEVGTLISLKGEALVSSFDIDMPESGDITYSGTLKGNSELSEVTTINE